MGLTTKRPHADLKRAVMKAVNLLPGVFVFPCGTGAFRSEYKGRARYIRLGMAGTPDLVGWKVVGSDDTVMGDPGTYPRTACFVALEIKVGKDTLRPEQRAFLDKVREAGGIAVEVRSVEQAVEALR